MLGGNVRDDTLPGTCYWRGGLLAREDAEMRERTFPVDPQQGSRLFPVPECAALNEPRRRAFVMNTTRSVKIYGRIWRGEPFSDVLSQLIPCENTQG